MNRSLSDNINVIDSLMARVDNVVTPPPVVDNISAFIENINFIDGGSGEMEAVLSVYKDFFDGIMNISTVEELRAFIDNNEPCERTALFVHSLHIKRLDVEWLRVISSYNTMISDNPGGLPAYAASEGSLDVVRYVLNEVEGFDVNKFYQSTRTMLHEACNSGHIEVVEELLSHGADHSMECIEGYLPSNYAVRNNHIAIIDRLYLVGAQFEGCMKNIDRDVNVDTIVHLFELGLRMSHEDFRNIAHVNDTLLIEVITLLRSRPEKRPAYQCLESVLNSCLYYIRNEGESNTRLRFFVTHFSIECVKVSDANEREFMRKILLPYVSDPEVMTYQGTRRRRRVM